MPGRSLLSKSTLVTLPFVFLLLDFWPLGRRTESWVRLVAEKAPFFLLTVVFSRNCRDGPAVAMPSRLWTPFRSRRGVPCALAAYAAYLGHTLVPFHLAIYYPHPGERLSIGTVGLSVVLLAGISLFAVASRRRFPFVFVGWAWYLGTLVPMIGLVQIGTQQMADRYTYFPLIGIFVAVTWLVGAFALARSVPECVVGWGRGGPVGRTGLGRFRPGQLLAGQRDSVRACRREHRGEPARRRRRLAMPSCPRTREGRNCPSGIRGTTRAV